MVSSRDSEAGDRVNILVVDDSLTCRVLAENVLEPLGEHVVCCECGESALAEVKRETYAVVLLDVSLPGISGLEVARLIRKEPATKNLPIIFLTENADDCVVQESYSIGAVDYLLKPLVPGALRAKVAVFAELRRTLNRLASELQERQQLEAQLRQSQKMEAVGQLAGGVAHDFNNILTVIRNYAEFAAEPEADPSQCRDDMSVIVEASDRGAALVRQLLSFARPHGSADQVLDANEVGPPHAYVDKSGAQRRHRGGEHPGGGGIAGSNE